MKTILQNKYKMYLAIKEFFATWLAVLNLLPHFTEFHTAFLNDLQEIQNLSEQQLFNSKGNGMRLKRQKLKLALIDSAGGVADKLYAYALFIKDQILQNEVHYTPSTMKISSDVTVLKWSKGIYERAELHFSEAAPYGINEATLADFRNALGEFETSMPMQRISTTNQKLNTALLAEHFTKIDESVMQIDALIRILISTQPILCATYDLRRKILNYGTRSIAVRGLVTDSVSKIGIKGVTIAFLNADGSSLQPAIIKKSATKGGFNIKSFNEGVYLIKMTKVGYNDLTSTHTIVNGELCKIFAEMIKI
jgi:hypothetical protein